MKIFTVMGLLLLPMAVYAQQPQGMGGMDLQKMMEQAQAIQTCMQNVDQAELDKFQQRAMEVNQEMKSLCAEGKRDKAQSMAMDFAQEAEKDKAIQEMKKCGEMAKGMMPEMAEMPQTYEDVDYSKQHVCDHLAE